jgi:hypothetical protein
MSTNPSIERVVKLATLKPVIEVLSATQGNFDERQIVVTIDGDVPIVAPVAWASGTNFYTLDAELLDIPAMERGAEFEVYVEDHETVSDTWKATATETFTNNPLASYEGTIRQTITDILRAAEIEIDGQTATVQVDDFGKPILVRRKGASIGPIPIIEIGPAVPAGYMIESPVAAMATTDVSITVAHAADDPNEAIDALPVLVNRVVEALNATGRLDLNLMGVMWPWRYRFGSEFNTLENDNAVSFEMGVIIDQQRETGAYLPE